MKKKSILPLDNTVSNEKYVVVPSDKAMEAGITSYSLSTTKSAANPSIGVGNSNGGLTTYNYKSLPDNDWEVNYGRANIRFRSNSNTVTYSYGIDVITVVDMDDMSYEDFTSLNSLGQKALDDMEEMVLVTYDMATNEQIETYSNGDGGVAARPMCVDWSRSRCEESFRETIMLASDCDVRMDCLCGAGDYFCICGFHGCE